MQFDTEQRSKWINVSVFVCKWSNSAFAVCIDGSRHVKFMATPNETKLFDHLVHTRNVCECKKVSQGRLREGDLSRDST